jgi:hypothetical protein
LGWCRALAGSHLADHSSPPAWRPAPAGHGTYQGLDLELLDPDDEGELTFLLEAQHLELEEALERGEEITTADGEPMNPRLPAGRSHDAAQRGGPRAELGVLEQPLELLPDSLVGLGSQRIAGRQYAVGG